MSVWLERPGPNPYDEIRRLECDVQIRDQIILKFFMEGNVDNVELTVDELKALLDISRKGTS